MDIHDWMCQKKAKADTGTVQTKFVQTDAYTGSLTEYAVRRYAGIIGKYQIITYNTTAPDQTKGYQEETHRPTHMPLYPPPLPITYIFFNLMDVTGNIATPHWQMWHVVCMFDKETVSE